MSSMPVSIVSDDAEWKEALAAGLEIRGFRAIPLFKEGDAMPRMRNKPLAMLVDAKESPEGVVQLAQHLTLVLGPTCPALIFIGDPEYTYESDLFDGRTSRPDDAGELLDELEVLIPKALGMGSSVVARANAPVVDDDDVKSAG